MLKNAAKPPQGPRPRPAAVPALSASARRPARVPRRAASAAPRAASAPAAAPPTTANEAHLRAHALPAAQRAIEPYARADAHLTDLLALPDLDGALAAGPAAGPAPAAARARIDALLSAVDAAMDAAYGPEAGSNAAFLEGSAAAFCVCEVLQAAAAPCTPNGSASSDSNEAAAAVTAAHTFLQRVLYRINRLNHFWFDALAPNYTNERSLFLQSLRNSIERRWQLWEVGQMPKGTVEACLALAGRPEEVKQALRDRYARDVSPPLSPALSYIQNEMGHRGYAHLLAIGSLDGLVEASRQSRVCAGTANRVSAAVFRVLSDEYGRGRLEKKHSTFYAKMMRQEGLSDREEGYLDLVPWQALASANSNFLLTERRRHYLRYLGGLTFFEISGPAVYRAYRAAAARCGLPEAAHGYWGLHVKEDEAHGAQMLAEVALPLVDMYPRDAWEVLFGYDQEAFLSARAGAAVAEAIHAAEAAAGVAV